MSEAPPPRFERVGIVGLGLLGGSLARALKTLPDPPLIRAFSLHEQDLRIARRAGAVDEVTAEAAEAAADQDLVVYAAPLEATLGLLSAHADVWAPGTVVTDVVSLKQPLLERVRRLGAAGRYVGAHPMAGGEGSGFEASRPGLFRDAVVWLVRGDADSAAAEAVAALWSALDARPRWTEAERHDRRMVWVSHLPQVVANALASVLSEEEFASHELGPGGRDMTRLAASSPEMWQDLLAASGPELAPALRAVARELEEIARWVGDGDVESVTDLMGRTRRWRGGP